MEIWKSIKDYEDSYEVSSHGIVKSVSRTRKGKNNSVANVKERILKHNKNKNGYFYVHLCKNGKTTQKSIHQLVAVAFLNHVPSGMKVVVDHKDENKENNNKENLQLISHRENIIKSKPTSSFKEALRKAKDKRRQTNHYLPNL